MSVPAFRTFLRAVAAACAATVVSLFVHTAVQQTYRTGADDPQVQLASDAAEALRAGATPAAVVPADSVNLARALAPFVIVYDSADRPIAGSGRLGGAIPVPPPGVLAQARAAGSNHRTWQPRRGVRIASVLIRVDDASGRVVLAGRSLREVEERESRLLVMTALAWAALLIASVLAAVL